MADDVSLRLEAALRRELEPQRAADLMARLGVSQSTLSRAVARLGKAVVRVGRGPATRYALARPIGRAGHRWPLYRIDEQGRAVRHAEITALSGRGFHVSTDGAPPASRGDLRRGLFPGVPWFLDDQRPQGFLGRAIARRVASELGVSEDPRHWSADDVALFLVRNGHDQAGDLVWGEASLHKALNDGAAPLVVDVSDREQRYPELADSALRGDVPGSSAAGEQPKFLATRSSGATRQAVIVKFSPRSDRPDGVRWGDLLACEHVAGMALRAAGIAAAESEVVQAGGRTFLESVRFDRTLQDGRRGFATLAALDAEHYGHLRIDWWRFAAELCRDGWLDAADAQRLAVLGLFGELIGNTDMHLGNAGVVFGPVAPLALAPCYDCSPMRLAPGPGGEIVEREWTVSVPPPELEADWRAAADIAQDFWTRVEATPLVSPAFRVIAARSRDELARVRRRFE